MSKDGAIQRWPTTAEFLGRFYGAISNGIFTNIKDSLRANPNKFDSL